MGSPMKDFISTELFLEDGDGELTPAEGKRLNAVLLCETPAIGSGDAALDDIHAQPEPPSPHHDPSANDDGPPCCGGSEDDGPPDYGASDVDNDGARASGAASSWEAAGSGADNKGGGRGSASAEADNKGKGKKGYGKFGKSLWDNHPTQLPVRKGVKGGRRGPHRRSGGANACWYRQFYANKKVMTPDQLRKWLSTHPHPSGEGDKSGKGAK